MKSRLSRVSFAALVMLVANAGKTAEADPVVSAEQWIAFAERLEPFGKCIDAYVAQNRISQAELGVRLAASSQADEFLKDAIRILGMSNPFASSLVDAKFGVAQKIPVALAGLAQLAVADTTSRADKVRSLGTARLFEARITHGECIPSTTFTNIVNSMK